MKLHSINHPLFHHSNFKHIREDVDILQILSRKSTYKTEISRLSNISKEKVKWSLIRLEKFGLINQSCLGYLKWIELTEDGRGIVEILKEGEV